MYTAIVASLAALAVAAPTVDVEKRQSAINDGVILNYALTLEHLENAFYKEGLAKFSKVDFEKFGLAPSFYNNLKEISFDEQTHVKFLSGALTTAGVAPVDPCQYKFGITDVNSFLTLANVLEGVGVSAYLGAAQFIANKAYLTAAGSILTVEARHSAYLRGNQMPAKSPFPNPFDDPLSFNQVFTLAAPFITACPGKTSSLKVLPVTGFPSIAASPAGVAKVGDKIKLTISKPVDAKYAYFITVAGPVAAPLTGSGTCYYITVPKGTSKGQTYVVLTKSEGTPTDDTIVAGPAIIEVADNAFGRPADNAVYNQKPTKATHY